MLRSVLPLVELEYQGEPVKVDGFRLRDLEAWRTANDTSLVENLGSLSTVCNCHCRFCYEDGNPPGLFEREPPFVSLEEAETRRRYLHDGRGLPRESKGFFEPLANPHFLELLELAREQDPEGLIDVTTNGAGLTEELIDRLATLAPIYVNVSLISSRVDLRRAVMADRLAGQAVRAVELLREREIPFMGTLVPWPDQGLEDVAATLAYLDRHEARFIRVSMPGLSRHHRRYRPGHLDAWLPQVRDRVLAVREDLATPILISPWAHVTSSIDPVVEGVVPASPAAEAGLRVGDRIVEVDGKRVVSRAHAVSLLERAMREGVVRVTLRRGAEDMVAILHEPAAGVDAYPYRPRGYARLDFPGMHFGIVLPGSFRPQYLKQIRAAIEERAAQHTLVLTSHLLHGLVAELCSQVPWPDGADVELLVPENRYFGGDVTVGDLWVLEDVAAAVREYGRSHGAPNLIILPSSFLSRWHRDLLGVPYTELERSLGIPVALVTCERILL
ncbi:MAG: DUF512 domain-containing protein [Actinobacteria bacterium]|nr:DUF512 domain-containing protein [Actinomycetota bacterium]